MNWMPVLAPRTILVPCPGVQDRLGSSPGTIGPSGCQSWCSRTGCPRREGMEGMERRGGEGKKGKEWWEGKNDWEEMKERN